MGAKKKTRRNGGPHIKVTFEIITEESAAEGCAEETGWIDEDGASMAPDLDDVEEGITAVEKAVKFMKDEGVTEASSSHFHKGVWYTAYGEADLRSGDTENHSFHLYGFSPAEEEVIFKAMTKRGR